ncbi:MAG: hypothetical protein IPL39_12980 [Opitutaceae bacterium]|nr:hypothetical protein [Opitutaceae bacterium]
MITTPLRVWTAGLLLLLVLAPAARADNAAEASPAAPAAPNPEDEIILLGCCYPFEEVEKLQPTPSFETGRLRTEVQDSIGAVSVATPMLLEDLGARYLEDVLAATCEPLDHPVFARAGMDSGLLDRLPIATVVDLGTVEHLVVQSGGPAWSEVVQRRASYRPSGLVEGGICDGGRTSAKVHANAVGSAQNLAALAVLTHSNDEHESWGAYTEGWARIDDTRLEANLQWQRLAGYGRTALGKVGLMYGRHSNTQARVTVAWHELVREDPLQFLRNSATARFDGLGFFNLDLLTGPVRSLGDRLVEVGLAGAISDWGRHEWDVAVLWHRQTSDWVWPDEVTLPALVCDDLQFTAGDRLSLVDDKVHLRADLGWSRRGADEENTGARGALRWAAGGGWRIGGGVELLVELGHEEMVPVVPSGEVRRVGASWTTVGLPTEHRDSIQAGIRVHLFGELVEGSVGGFGERVVDSAFRDWAWEAAHPTAVVTRDGGWISPARYGVDERFCRAGWRTEWTVRPWRDFMAVCRWYEDRRDQGPVIGGNHRGMMQARYDFPYGYLKGVSLGGGLDYRNAVRFNDGEVLAGGLKWHLAIGYTRRLTAAVEMSVELTLRNLGCNEYQPTRFANDRGRELQLRVAQKF